MALQRPLRLRGYHVLHFVGHGRYDEDAQDGALALEGPDGRTQLTTGRDVGMMIRAHRSLRLVVLNACEGARSAADDPFGGVAQAIVRHGIPGVIAMQFEISDPAAVVFSQSFYQAIADGLPVDVATSEARRTMWAVGYEVEWAAPVLYLRSADGRVFTRGRVWDAPRAAREEPERAARGDAEEAVSLGERLEEQGDVAGAQAAYQQAIDSGDAETTPHAAYTLGALLQDQGDVSGARAAYQRAIDSGHAGMAPIAAFILGSLLKEQGDVTGARAAYQRAIDSGHPDHAPVAAYNLELLLRSQKDMAGARAAYQIAIDSGDRELVRAARRQRLTLMGGGRRKSLSRAPYGMNLDFQCTLAR